MEKEEVGRSKGIHISKYLGFLFQRDGEKRILKLGSERRPSNDGKSVGNWKKKIW